VTTQLEIGRAVNAYPLGIIGFFLYMGDEHTVYINLSDTFIMQYGLVYKLPEGAPQIPGPTVKLNFAAVAKVGSQDKTIMSNALTSIFAIIGELLADHP